MININLEGPSTKVWNQEEENNLSLHEYLIMREKMEVEKLKLEMLENKDESAESVIANINKEIAKLNEKIVELGGEIEINS